MAEIISAVDVVSLDEVKQQLRIMHSDDDILLGGLISAATLHLTKTLRAPVSDGVWREDFDVCHGPIMLEVRALDPIDITYLDLDDVEQTYADFTVTHRGSNSWIEASDEGWPDAESLTVEYAVAGPSAPATLKVAAMMHVAALYSQPSAVADRSLSVVPLGYDEMIAPYRRF